MLKFCDIINKKVKRRQFFMSTIGSFNSDTGISATNYNNTTTDNLRNAPGSQDQHSGDGVSLSNGAMSRIGGRNPFHNPRSFNSQAIAQLLWKILNLLSRQIFPKRPGPNLPPGFTPPQNPNEVRPMYGVFPGEPPGNNDVKPVYGIFVPDDNTGKPPVDNDIKPMYGIFDSDDNKDKAPGDKDVKAMYGIFIPDNNKTGNSPPPSIGNPPPKKDVGNAPPPNTGIGNPLPDKGVGNSPPPKTTTALSE
jgi:hypothetical protein